MSVYKVNSPGEGLFYVRVCTEQVDAKGNRPDCNRCGMDSYQGECKIKGRFVWKDYGGKEGALEAAKAFIREFKQKEAV